MISKRLIATVLLLTGVATSSYATVSLQFSQGGIGATNFANSSGVVSNGMSWGILVDTAGDGFSGTAYDGFASSISNSQFLLVGGVATDDYFIPSGLQTSTIGAPFFSGAEAGSGAITSITSVPLGSNNINQGDTFGLFWLSSNSAADGDYYGLFTNGAFTLPADSSTTPYSSVFTGSDPIRSASNQFAAVPEPSRMLLLGMAMFGLIFRRRR